MAIDVITGFNIKSRTPLNTKYGPYTSLVEALQQIPENERTLGLIFGVVNNETKDSDGVIISGNQTRYIFLNGVTNSDAIQLIDSGDLSIVDNNIIKNIDASNIEHVKFIKNDDSVFDVDFSHTHPQYLLKTDEIHAYDTSFDNTTGDLVIKLNNSSVLTTNLDGRYLPVGDFTPYEYWTLKTVESGSVLLSNIEKHDVLEFAGDDIIFLTQGQNKLTIGHKIASVITNQATAEELACGVDFTVLDSITEDQYGHISSITTKKYKTPAHIQADKISVSDQDNNYNSSDVESILSEVGEMRHFNGFDTQTPESMPDISFDDSTRTLTCSVKSGSNNFYFWVNAHKYIKTSQETITIPDDTNTYYIYFDTDGVIQYVAHDNIVPDIFYKYAITALVYWNSSIKKGIVGSELHGVRMDSKTHQYNHDTFGARFQDGMSIIGLTDGGNTYTQTTPGHFWDEDIQHSVASLTEHPFMYREGQNGAWVFTAPDNKVSYNNGGTYDVWNEFDGTTWKLTQGTTSTDFWIIFYVAIPDITGYQIKKVIGQSAYANRTDARSAIETEIKKISMDGLPSPEFVFLYATIVKRDGTLKTLTDGSTYLDLRYTKGIGGISISSMMAQDVITDATNFNNRLSTSDTNVQKALETLDQMALSGKGILTPTDSAPTSPNMSDWYFANGDGDYTNLGLTGVRSGNYIVWNGTNWTEVEVAFYKELFAVGY